MLSGEYATLLSGRYVEFSIYPFSFAEYIEINESFGKKQSVEAQAYLQMQKSYAAVIKQLTDLIPKQETSKAGEEILNFIGTSRSPRK